MGRWIMLLRSLEHTTFGGVGSKAEFRHNPYHDPATGRFTSGGGSGSGVDKSEKIDYNKINEEISNNSKINADIGIAEKPEPVDIQSYHKHALKRMEERNITKENAQNYVNSSIIAFNQKTAEAYYSTDGVSVIRKRDSKLITTFSENDFDDCANEIIKVAKKHGL